MIVTETITIRNKEYIRTYSDQNKLIERDGVQYSEAIDPLDSDREYTETDITIDYGEEATEEDYQNALAEMGVDLNG